MLGQHFDRYVYRWGDGEWRYGRRSAAVSDAGARTRRVVALSVRRAVVRVCIAVHRMAIVRCVCRMLRRNRSVPRAVHWTRVQHPRVAEHGGEPEREQRAEWAEEADQASHGLDYIVARMESPLEGIALPLSTEASAFQNYNYNCEYTGSSVPSTETDIQPTRRRGYSWTRYLGETDHPEG